MNLLKSKPKTAQQALADAGLKRAAPAVKELMAAVDRFRTAKEHRERAATDLDAVQREYDGRGAVMDELKVSLGMELASGGKTESEVAEILRAARGQEDLLDTRIHGAGKRLEIADTEFQNALDGLTQSHFTAKMAIGDSINRLLVETATPFAEMVRSAMAIDAALRLGLDGLHNNRIADPLASGPGLPVNLELKPGMGNFDWMSDADAVALSNTLDPIGQSIFEATYLAMTADRERAERIRMRSDDEHLRRIAAHERVFGVGQQIHSLSDPRIAAESAKTA